MAETRSDHYIDFMNPVLWSLEAGIGERASGCYPTSRGRFASSSGDYLPAACANPSAYLLRRKYRAETPLVLARQRIIFWRKDSGRIMRGHGKFAA